MNAVVVSPNVQFWLSGKGRGRQVIAVARTADLVLMMLDAAKGDNQRYEI
jgi:ribosome-interacting GTPase 1